MSVIDPSVVLLRTQMLATIPLFSAMDEQELGVIAAIMDEARFDAGAAIYRARDQGGTCYIVTQGRVALSIDDSDGGSLLVDELEPGELFGELSLLDGGDRSTNAVTIEPTSVLVLERPDLLDVLRAHPDTAFDLILVLVRRIRRIDDLLRHRATRNANEALDDRATLGERVADAVARFGGSWLFIGSFGLFLLIWVVVNTALVFYGPKPFDPYPFILLNLMLSMIAALQAPIIMMSQNRQDARDRVRSELDYQVNLKAELEIATLSSKLDALSDLVRAGQHAAGG